MKTKDIDLIEELITKLDFAIIVNFENWPLKDCCLVLAAALITAVTFKLVLSSSGVLS
jgi:hypothetical protein